MCTFYLKEWSAVQYIEDDVLYMCQSKDIDSNVKIGQSYMVKWKNRRKYLAKVLKTGSMFLLIMLMIIIMITPFREYKITIYFLYPHIKFTIIS